MGTLILRKSMNYPLSKQEMKYVTMWKNQIEKITFGNMVELYGKMVITGNRTFDIPNLERGGMGVMSPQLIKMIMKVILTT